MAVLGHVLVIVVPHLPPCPASSAAAVCADADPGPAEGVANPDAARGTAVLARRCV